MYVKPSINIIPPTARFSDIFFIALMLVSVFVIVGIVYYYIAWAPRSPLDVLAGLIIMLLFVVWTILLLQIPRPTTGDDQ